MIKPLPKWVLTENQPAFYDIESVSAIEMVARLYKKMEELVNNYNEFVDLVNDALETQDQEINDAVNYLQTNLVETVTALYNEGFEQGDYVSLVSVSYDETDEELTIEDTLKEAESEEF